MRVRYTRAVSVGWEGDSQNGWPEYRHDTVEGEVVAFIPRHEQGAAAVVLVNGKFDVVDVSELEVVP